MYNEILQKLQAYKRKFYLNLLLKGSLLTAAALLSAFLVVNFVEYFGQLGTWFRAGLFYGFLGLAVATFVFWIVVPVLRLLELHRPLSNEQAAQQIGQYFPQVSDKLLNVLQLGTLSAHEGGLIAASIEQKAQGLSLVNFTEAVSYQSNRRYLRYALPPLLLLVLLLLFVPQLFTESMPRLVNYSQTFAPKAPFAFGLKNKELSVFKNEDFELVLQTTGSALPSEAYLLVGDRRVKMERKASGEFIHTFKKVQKPVDFSFEASGFTSAGYRLNLVERPNLNNFTAYLNYPAYLRKADEKLTNTGNLIVPQGTVIRWVFSTQQAEQVSIQFKGSNQTLPAQAKGGNTFELAKKAMQSEAYAVNLRNQHSANKEAIEYFLNVTPDEYPTITLQQERDTAMYDYLAIGGNIADDYGISRLEFKYRVVKDGQKADDSNPYRSVNLGHNANVISQSYFHQVRLADFNLQQGDRLEYYVQVWDNDGINGAKSSKTGNQEFKLPSQEEFSKEMESAAANTSNQMEGALQKAKQVKKDLDELQERLKGKKKLTWQDKQAIEELLRKKAELEKDITQLQQQNQMLNQRQERFSQQNHEIAEKAQQLQKLMDELMDEETRRLYDELQKLIQQEYQNQRVQDVMQQLEKNEKNLEKELERSLEMFKKLQFEQKMQQTTKELEKLSEDQKDLAEQSKQIAEKQEKNPNKTDQNKAKEDAKNEKAKGDKAKDDSTQTNDKKPDSTQNQKEGDSTKQPDNKDQKSGDNKDQKNGEQKPDKQGDKPQNESPKNDPASPNQKPENLEQLTQKQEQLNQEFEKLQEKMEEMEKMNEQLDNPKEFDKEALEKMAKDIEQQQQQSQQELQQKQPQKAAKSQRQAAQKMQQMAQQMQQMQQGMEMEQQTEDYNALRQILENLVKLSFDQENLMVQLRGVRQEDPRFVELGQQQLKLKDNAKVIEDSLFALAKRVFQIQSFVTREVANMNDYMNQGLEELKKRNIPVAASKQQFTMTSINNLALMLDDVLHQMQQNMGQQMGGMQIVNKKRPQKGQQLGEQQKSLNQQMQDLMKSGKSGRELSEDLAKLAAQQELIRRALKQAMQGQPKPGEKDGQQKGDNGDLGKLLDEMEKTEEDLVNKRLTQETVKRQKEILTRLLESEKALREREEDEKREAQQAKEKERRPPTEFADYLKTKEKQIELLKSIPASLNPYYKKEVNEYFKKINE
jgi:hypothetical protein